MEGVRVGVRVDIYQSAVNVGRWEKDLSRDRDSPVPVTVTVKQPAGGWVGTGDD